MAEHHPFDSENLSANPSDNEHFQSVVTRAVSRRGFLKSGLGVSAALFLAGLSTLPERVIATQAVPTPPLLGFDAIATATDDTLHLASGYRAQIIAPWGTPLLPGAEAWKPDGSDNAAAQATQVGDNHDGLHFFPLNGQADEGLLVVNHEYTTLFKGEYRWLFGEGGTSPWTADKALKAMNAHGISVIHIKQNSDRQWHIDHNSRYNRRITATTPMHLAGPAAGHALLKTQADPSGMRVLGTLNNCGNGWTPWGTYLTCEENFNLYFGSTTEDDTRSLAQKRYGLPAKASAFRWEEFDSRFNTSKDPNESNRFGWVVEIDPFDPASTPKKRTALGRIKHENAAHTLTPDSRVVIYMGDDQRDDYIYKFVSDGHYQPDGDNTELLDSGKLYVARFTSNDADDLFMGSGEWLLLDKVTNPVLAADTRFADQGEVLINTRLAADAVGATKMDRPEWVAVHPGSGEVYVTLTNNDRRTEPDAANPRIQNVYGQILRWREADGNAAATRFEWDVFVLAGNPLSYPDRSDLRSGSPNISADNMFNSPDGLAFDAHGRLWIQTDGNYTNSGDFEGQSNNQMLCADPASGEIRRFMVGPKECEVTGIAFTPDHKTLFVNIQHPGEKGGGHWPDGGQALPRSATVAITREDGGIIGA